MQKVLHNDQPLNQKLEMQLLSYNLAGEYLKSDKHTQRWGKKTLKFSLHDCTLSVSSVSTFLMHSLFPLVSFSSYLCFINKSDQTFPHFISQQRQPCDYRTADYSTSLCRAIRFNTYRMDPSVCANRATRTNKATIPQYQWVDVLCCTVLSVT